MREDAYGSKTRSKVLDVMFAACTERKGANGGMGGREAVDEATERALDAMTRDAEDGASGSGRSIFGDEEWPSVEGASFINRAIFQAPPSSYGEKQHPWSPAHCVRVRSGVGYEFPCVWVPCRRAPAERVVIHCHANACDIGHIHALCARDAECWRANVLLVEYPGYGTSPGVAYERSVDRHVAAAYAYVTEECGVKPKDIFVLGRSLGTGPATKLAAAVERLYGVQLGGVILHSPFTSVKEAGLALLGQIAHIMTDRWDNRVWVQRYQAKTLIVHALEDEVVPFEHAKILDEKRRSLGLNCKLHATHGTHNYFSYYKDYLQPIGEFIDATVKPGAAPFKLPAFSDPLPRAAFSEAQVKKIMSIIKSQAPSETDREVSLGLRFYGMVDAMGDTISPGDASPTKQNGFSRFGSQHNIGGGESSSSSTPVIDKTRSISPTSTIVGPNDGIESTNQEDEMILTPGGARPHLGLRK